MLNIFKSTPVDKYEPNTIMKQCRANKLFSIVRYENNKDCLPINLLDVQREQLKEPRKFNYKTSAYILNQRSGY